MRAKFWGVRGAVAAPGKASVDVGGNTSCVEVRTATGALVILDAGIGLYWLGRSLLAGPHGRGQGEASIFLTRTHWDHIQGIPFFVPAFLPGNKVHVHGAAYGGGKPSATRPFVHADPMTLRQILEAQMREAYSPIVALSNMPSIASTHDLRDGDSLVVGGATVRALVAPRAEGEAPVVAYRVEEDGRSLVYVTDVDYSEGGPGEAFVAFARGADVLIHEAFFTEDERRGGRVAPGHRPSQREHATFGDATTLALAAAVRRLYFSHHHPDRDDQAIARAVEGERARIATCKARIEADTAREGVELHV